MASRQEKLESVFSGSLGRFWTGIGNRNPDGESLTGYIRRANSGLLEVEVLVELEDLDNLPNYLVPKVTSAVGLIRPTVIALFDPAPHTASLKIGGGASVEIYRFRAVSTNVDVDEMRSTNIYEISGRFRNLLSWASLSSLNRTIRTDDSHRVQRVDYTLQSNGEILETFLTPTTSVRVEPIWRTDEDRESAFIYTYLQVTVASTRPRPVDQMARILLDIRKLLSTLHQRDVWAERCAARLDIAESGTVDFWHEQINTQASRSGDFSQNDTRAFVSLRDLGGPEVIARWIRFSQKYPRLVSPITNYWSAGGKPAAVELTELAMAMEYGVAAAKKVSKRPKWTRTDPPVAAIVNRVGRPFANWCQDPEKWSTLFWDTYNHLKHNHLDRDPREIGILAIGARILLTAYVLDRVSGSRATVAKFLNDYRWEGIRTRTRELLANSHISSMSRRQRRRARGG